MTANPNPVPGNAHQRRSGAVQRPPAGLSRWARGVWASLLAENDFSEHELVTFRRALEWWDRSDRWLAASEQASGKDRTALVKQALDASTAALRHWKSLKFTDPARPARRPGRPGGDDWSALRKAGAEPFVHRTAGSRA